jgi:hypothetical protein
MKDNSDRIIALLTILASAPRPSRGFETPEAEFERYQQYRHEALRELAQLQSNPAVFQMLKIVTNEMPSDGGTRDQVLRRVGELAASLLPEFLREQTAEAGLTNHERFLREAGAVDPFIDGTHLTRDSYAGCAEIERDTWSEV